MIRSLLTVIFMTAITAMVFAQTGPAGIGNSATNILWLDAQNTASLSGTLVNDDPVTVWSDLSGNDNDFVQQGSDAVPYFRNDGLDAGSFNVVRFDGTERYLVLADNDDLDLNVSGMTIIGVYNRTATDGDPRGILSKRTSYSSNVSYYVYTYTDNKLYFNLNTSGNTGVVSAGANSSGDNLFTVSYDGALQRVYKDASLDGSVSKSGTVANNSSSFFMGALNNDYGTYFNGELAEIIMFRSALNDAERLIIENYLAEKYNLSITNDFFGNYANYDVSYNDDLRGIGTGDGSALHSSSGFSSGLQIEASNGLDNTNEFVLFSHNASDAHADGNTSNIAASDLSGGIITNRWAKDYFLEVSQGGVIDAASIDAEFRFDFSEAGLTFSGSVSDYVLLYRETSSDDFDRVFAYDYSLENGDQVVASIPASRLKSGYYTLGRGKQLSSRKWYVLQNGDWSDPDNWTLDAGSAPIPNNPSSETPGVEDDVIIRNGKTVTIQPTTNNLKIASLTVDGTLNITTSSGHDFSEINGQGTIRLSGNGGLCNFPEGSTTGSNGFGNPANGGLLAIQGNGFKFNQDATFKDVRILLDDPSDIIELGSNLTINGDFNVRYGTFQFGDGSGTSRTFTVIGNFNVESNGGTQDGHVTTAYVAASSVRHEFNLYGDFLNEGTAQFSDRTTVNYSNESTNGVVDINLVSTTSDQRVDCNGPTYFYRLEVVKGSIDFMANIQADDPGNFVLTGFSNDDVDKDVNSPSDNDNAFALITGTASLGTNVSIRLNTTGNYSIGSSAKLVIAGAEVTKTGGAAITPYGVLEVSSGVLEVSSGSGITTRDAGQINVSGGTVWVSQIRTSIQGSVAQGGFEQTGGVVNVWDYSASESPVLGQAAGSPNGDYARFCLTYEGNAFTMTGGTLNVKDATSSGLLFINSDPDNVNVTGGEVNLYSTTTGTATVASEASFWDVGVFQENTGSIGVGTLTCGPGGADDRTISDPVLKVLSDLTLGEDAQLVMNDNDLYIGEDFTIEDNVGGVTYQPGLNTTYFNGTKSGLITFKSTQADMSGGYLEFNNLVLDKTASKGIYFEYDFPFKGNVTRVQGDITIQSGFWNLGNENLVLLGDNVTVYGTLGVYDPETSDGIVVFRNSAFNLITNDDAKLGYVRDNNIDEMTLTSDVYIQRLWWRRGRWNLGKHNLKIDVLDIRPNTDNDADYVNEDGTTVCENCLSTNYMFATSGNASDGGLSLMVPADGINTGILRSDNGDATRDIFDYRGNVIANTTGGASDDRLYIFPVGVGLSGIDAEFGDPTGVTSADTSKYTPIYLHIEDVTGVSEDSVYVTIRPVDGELKTTDLSGGEVLSYYWKVQHEYTGTTPIIQLETDYYSEDLDGGSNETLYVPGKVEGAGGYERSYEDSSLPESEFIDATNNRIVWNGGSDSGFALENANYTAGEVNRFMGAPEVYYTRLFNQDAWNVNWRNTNYWTREGEVGFDASNPHSSSNPAVGDYPKAGDIAVVGWVPFDDPYANSADLGKPHGISVNTTENVAELIFTQLLDASDNPTARVFASNFQFRPTVVVNPNGDINADVISGEGNFWVRSTGGNISDPDFSDSDLGNFNAQDSSYFTYEFHIANSPTTYNNIPTVLPNLLMAADGWGANDADVTLGNSFTTTSNLEILGNANVSLSSGSNGDITVGKNLRLFRSNAKGNDSGGGVEFLFPNNVSRTVEVFGNLSLEYGGMLIEVANPDNATQEVHNLIVHGDIIQDSNSGGDDGLKLYTSSGYDYIQLELKGEGNHSYTRTSGDIPNIGRLVMNKGAGTESSFSFNTTFTLPTSLDIGNQPVEIVNGLLVFNDPSIDVTLADGTIGSFYLPNTLNYEAASGSGGLEIQQGKVSVSGDDTGIVLDGLLRISGGTLDMAVTGDNGNNFIEYGASDMASIELSAGELKVGSQVRRKLTSINGLLNYTQTGGTAIFGVEAAPENTRGVFEVTNSGSEFTHTGGDFIIVRQNGSSTVGSLIIKPDGADLEVTGSTITIGNTSTPTGQKKIGVESDVPLNNLLITGNNSPTVMIYNTDLEVNTMTIESGASFHANGYDFTLNEDLVNNGSFTNGGTDINQQTTYFPSGDAQQISGSGLTSFFNLEKVGAGTFTIDKEITIDNDLSLLGGITNTSSYVINLKGDMMHDAIHTSAAMGPGIVFNGTDGQNLDTDSDTGEFGVLTLDNANGLEVPGDGRVFQVNSKIILNSGVFNIGGNLLIMNENAYFENGSGGVSRSDFNKNSMVSVNANITDNGVKKIYNDSFTGTYLYPVGLNYYTPAEVNVTSMTGGNTGEITIKPVEDIAGGITEDNDEKCFGDNSDYVDADNILQFYWLIKSANVSDFDGSIYLYHVDALESVDNTQGLDLSNYAPARLLLSSSLWDKAYSEALFDEANNVSMFQSSVSNDYVNFSSDDITGAYTAGISRDDSDASLCGGAIPDDVPEYVTLSSATSADVDNSGAFASTPAGAPPSLGESPDLRIAGDFTLNLTNQYWRFRKVTIEEGATLTVNGPGVNLGTVSGEGTLKLINTNALPAGDYSAFEANDACTTGGEFEMEVTSGNSVDLSLPFQKLRKLTLSGDGEKVITNGSSFDICENLEILDGGTLTLGDNTTFNIEGNILKSTTAVFDGDFSNAEFVLDGSSQQQIDGSFTGSEAFSSLELDNAAGLTIINASNNDVEVENMIMTEGKIATDEDNSLIILNTGDITGNFSSATFVDGPLKRRLETSNDRQLFPVGSGSVYLPFEISNTQGYSGTKDWMVKYHDEDPATSADIIDVNASYDFSTWKSEENTFKSKLFRQDLFEVEVASPAKADLRIYWDSDTDVGSSSSSWGNLRVMVWSTTNETWESYGNGNLTYSGMSASSGSLITDTEVSFSTKFVTLGYTEEIPLPVELTFFEAILSEDGSVLLSWQTATEINNDYFEVQRINAAGEFETIGLVQGAGDSKDLIDYSFIDTKPYFGINYYRLKQVDFDGEFEYSELVVVVNEGYYDGLDVTVYPNPVMGDEVGLLIKTGDELSELQFTLMDASGRVINKGIKAPVLGTSSYEISTRNIGSGLFYVVVIQGEHKQIVRVIVR